MDQGVVHPGEQEKAEKEGGRLECLSDDDNAIMRNPGGGAPEMPIR